VNVHWRQVCTYFVYMGPWSKVTHMIGLLNTTKYQLILIKQIDTWWMYTWKTTIKIYGYFNEYNTNLKMIDLVVSQTNNSNKSKYQQPVRKQGFVWIWLFCMHCFQGCGYLIFILGDLVYLMKNVNNWWVHQTKESMIQFIVSKPSERFVVCNKKWYLSSRYCKHRPWRTCRIGDSSQGTLARGCWILR